ncbi:hypothetical protein DPMN_083400 [Dreissena polymorpha]|uniref:Uncharacterized protein n=1 Tax=Dreissena polymorpha TaxID=45954 RepID=A0A9D3YB53_DREPO|nr:hypothetical protein DPMN_083400 [Dreissena polymorpha]
MTSRVNTAPPPGGHVYQRTATIFKLMLTRKDDPPLGSHVFQVTGPIFEISLDIMGTNILNTFHTDRTLMEKTSPCHWRPYIIGKNIKIKFHEDWTKNVTSRV